MFPVLPLISLRFPFLFFVIVHPSSSSPRFCFPAVLSSILGPALATWFLADISHCSLCPSWLNPPHPPPGFLQILIPLSGSILWNFRVETGDSQSVTSKAEVTASPPFSSSSYWAGPVGGTGQVVVMGGEGGDRPCMAALSLCLFDIWPERTARMKEKKKRQSGKRVKGEMGVFISCLAEYTTGIKKKWKRDRKRARKRKGKWKTDTLRLRSGCQNRSVWMICRVKENAGYNSLHQSKHNDFIFLTRRASS